MLRTSCCIRCCSYATKCVFYISIPFWRVLLKFTLLLKNQNNLLLPKLLELKVAFVSSSAKGTICFFFLKAFRILNSSFSCFFFAFWISFRSIASKNGMHCYKFLRLQYHYSICLKLLRNSMHAKIVLRIRVADRCGQHWLTVSRRSLKPRSAKVYLLLICLSSLNSSYYLQSTGFCDRRRQVLKQLSLFFAKC